MSYITVIVPSYNHKKFIRKCLVSIFNQTFKEFKVIVIDDGSTDGSTEVIGQLLKDYNFKFIQQSNRGLSSTLNFALKELTNTKYVTFCASDDYWVDNKLELQFVYMERNPECLMCYGKVYEVDEDGMHIAKKNEFESKLRGGNIFKDIFLMKLHPPVTYFFRMEAFIKVGYYDEDLFTEDYDMNLRIAEISNIGFIDEYLGYYRRHNISYRIKNYDRITNSHLKIIEKYRYKYYYLQKDAKKKIMLTKAYTYSPFRKKKIESIKLLIDLKKYFFRKEYLKAIANLLLRWY